MKGSRQAEGPAEERPMRERVYLDIQWKIASLQLPSGSSGSEPVLARKLGTSRTPSRQAMGQLVAAGLLAQTPNGGAAAVSFTGSVDRSASPNTKTGNGNAP